jgi:hypothetical protein
MTVTLANQWWHIGAFMALPSYILFMLSERGFTQWRQAINERGFVPSLPLCLRAFRWHLLCGAIGFGISVAVVVGIHKSFVSVEAGDGELTLLYTWPRSDVRLKWIDIKDARVETRQFGVWRAGSNRLSVTSDGVDYVSLWCGAGDNVQRAYKAVKMHLPHLE